jgi:Spy/CpxP family protein refolding chaperone
LARDLLFPCGAADGTGGPPERENVMKKISGWLVLGVAAAVGVTGLVAGTASAQQASAVAQEEDDEGGGPGMGRMERIREALGLTDGQLEQARALRQEFRDQTSDLRDQIKAKVKEIPDLIRKADLTQADLLSLHREVRELTDQIAEKKIEKLYKFWQQLTPEQRAKLGDLIAERMDDFGPGPGEGGHGRHGRGGFGGFGF